MTGPSAAVETKAPRTALTGLAIVGGGTVVLAVATAGMFAGVEPFATWYYPFAWYSVLLIMDAVVARRGGRYFLFGRPASAASLFGWSVPFWMFFELLNFRLANWYYVFVPDHPLARWVGITISFATVLPAIYLAERVLGTYGPWRDPEEPESTSEISDNRVIIAPEPRVVPGALLALQIAGLLCLVFPLVWPRGLFPLIWIGVTLIADPWVYRHDPRRSLLRDLELGQPRRVIRLLVGGMAIGLLWELFNVGARGKWIYTVPGLEELKLFEMPLLGFFGFPFLALEGWATYQALVVAGLAVDPGRRARSRPDTAVERPAGRSGGRPRRATLAMILAAVFSVLVLRGLEIETIDSYSPRLAELEGAPVEVLRRAGYDDVFALARAEPDEVASSTGVEPGRAHVWIEQARLATLRGIGTENAARLRVVGVATVGELATAEPEELARRLGRAGFPVRPARIGVWIRAASGE